MREGPGVVVLVDFDGTITEQDVGVVLLERFSTVDWRRIEERFARGEVDIQGNMQQQFANVPEDAPELVAYARTQVTIRPGWGEFVEYCHRAGLGLAIVSGGLDFYVAALLPPTEPPPPVHVLRTERGPNGWEVYLPADMRDDEGETGYKERVVARYRRRYPQVWFVGNGISDRGAATVADKVWAVEPLYSWCAEHGIEALPFETFHDIAEEMRVLLEGAPAAATVPEG